MTPLRVAIVGLSPIAVRRPPSGFFGRVCASHAAGYAAVDNCEVVAACDLRRDLVDWFRETWSDTWPAVAGYRDLNQMLFECRPDLVSVCTPDHAHREPIEVALRAGVRGLFCEAPLATSLPDAEAMLRAARNEGATAVVHHPHRYDPLFHLVRDSLRLGDIGQPLRLDFQHAGPRPMLFRQGCHGLNLLAFLAESPVAEVGGHLEPGYEEWAEYRGDGGHEPASEPVAEARLVFANGVVASYRGVRAQVRSLRLEASGTEGSIRVRDRHAELIQEDRRRHLVPRPYDTVGLAAATTELAQIVRFGGRSISGIDAGCETVAVLQAILDSARQGAAPVHLRGEQP